MKLTKNRLILLLALVILDVGFFSGVNPVKAPSLLLFLGFALLGCNVALGWYGLLWSCRSLAGFPKGRLRKPVQIATGVSLVLVALQSVGQLTVRDVLALLALTAVVWFYLSYLRNKQA